MSWLNDIPEGVRDEVVTVATRLGLRFHIATREWRIGLGRPVNVSARVVAYLLEEELIHVLGMTETIVYYGVSEQYALEAVNDLIANARKGQAPRAAACAPLKLRIEPTGTGVQHATFDSGYAVMPFTKTGFQTFVKHVEKAAAMYEAFEEVDTDGEMVEPLALGTSFTVPVSVTPTVVGSRVPVLDEGVLPAIRQFERVDAVACIDVPGCRLSLYLRAADGMTAFAYDSVLTTVFDTAADALVDSLGKKTARSIAKTFYRIDAFTSQLRPPLSEDVLNELRARANAEKAFLESVEDMQ